MNASLTVLRTFKATIEGEDRKVEQLKGVKDRQELIYRVYVNTLDGKLTPLELAHEIYWAFNPIEVKG